MRRLACLVALVLVLAACQPLGDQGRGGWTLRQAWEFNDGRMPPEWKPGWFGSGITAPVQSGEEACYDPARVWVAGGSLTLTSVYQPTSCGGKTRPIRSGIVTTNGRWSWSRGRIEARIWFDSCSGVICDWPVLWSNGQSWPQDGELDIAEGLSGNATCVWHATNVSGSCGRYGPTVGWHTYSVTWEGPTLISYLDGREIGRWSTGVVHTPHYLIAGLQYGQWGGPRKVPATMLVDYIRVWT